MPLANRIAPSVDIDSRYNLACDVARQAGMAALKMYRKRDTLAVEHKGLQDEVSVADRDTEDLVRRCVRDAFPDDAFFGEETASSVRADITGQRVIWVVDPIDGTSCFLHGMHTWCVSIGVLVDGEPVIGAVFDPNSGELFHASRGRGAFVNHLPIAASTVSDVCGGVLGVGFSHRVKPDSFIPFLERLLTSGGMFVRNGSGALMIAYVAAGRLIGYYEPHINAWDCLAGIVLVQEAGGVVNNFLAQGGLLHGNRIIASGMALYPRLLALTGADEAIAAGANGVGNSHHRGIGRRDKSTSKLTGD